MRPYGGDEAALAIELNDGQGGGFTMINMEQTQLQTAVNGRKYVLGIEDSPSADRSIC